MVAVFSVLLQHATHAGPFVHPELGRPLFSFPLEMGASGLVVMSAYFACASLAKGEPVRFLRNRLSRLLPAYAVAATFTFGVLKWVAPEGWSQLGFRDLVMNIFMLQNWVPDVRLVDYSYWTLPVQITGFIAGAFLCSRLRGPWLRVLLWTLVFGPLVMRIWTTEPGLVRTLYDGLGVHRAQLFAIGIGIWLWSKGRLGNGHLGALLVCALGAQAIHSSDLESTLGLGVLLLGYCAAASGPDWNVQPIRAIATPIKWLAGISYGVYLVHQEVGYVVMLYLARLGLGPVVQLVAFFATAVVLGWLLTRFVERPIHTWLTAESRGPELVRLVLAARLLAPRFTGGASAQSQLGSFGTSPLNRAPSWRPVSQPSTSAASPLMVTELSVPAVFNSQLR
ncbi:peptidoglycan/LPS O-acetylase OafA/YrhL [Umezawaea tangerina]|uniref:Peptidoglycan/LPS O-acetylase OafA/YrhL n=1 Tax=Umezawaea tangerina TaxID=84725 RepID=A0A2T0T998_9PSEU|nr:peptidoglycan/LPS O-acetylase OafA/YrhL [Umezawaea tangerina]